VLSLHSPAPGSKGRKNPVCLQSQSGPFFIHAQVSSARRCSMAWHPFSSRWRDVGKTALVQGRDVQAKELKEPPLILTLNASECGLLFENFVALHLTLNFAHFSRGILSGGQRLDTRHADTIARGGERGHARGLLGARGKKKKKKKKNQGARLSSGERCFLLTLFKKSSSSFAIFREEGAKALARIKPGC